MRHLLSLIALLLVVSGCGGGRSPAHPAPVDTLARIRSEGTVRIGVKADTPPFGRVIAGRRAGFDIDLAQVIAGSIGAEKIQWVTVTSQDRLDALLEGRVDLVLASMTITRTRDRRIDYSIPYFEDGQGLLVREDSQLRAYHDLAGRAVGVVRGSTSGANLRAVAPSAKLVRYEDFQHLLQGLLKGEVEAISTDRVILRGLALQAEGRALRLTGGAFSTEPYGVGLAPNQSALRDAVNEALQTMWEDGRYQAIYDSWFGPGTAYADFEPFRFTPYPR